MASEDGAEPQKRKRGRVSTFDQAVADEIVQRLSEGEPLTRICAHEGFPCDDTVRNWAAANEDFGRAIARAREAGFDKIALDALDIADDKSGDAQRDRLRVETRLKLLAKWDPKRYGEAALLKLGDPDGEKLSVTIKQFTPPPNAD